MHKAPIFSEKLNHHLKEFLGNLAPSKVVLITDYNTAKHCLPLVDKSFYTFHYAFPAGEINKNQAVLNELLSYLLHLKADRNTLLLALGGGMVTDMVGFAASIYKRGIPYINIPTSLLGMIDASIGGKTGIDFEGLKNAIGSFYPPNAIISNVQFLNTLPKEELKSGWAEVLKHLLIVGGPIPIEMPNMKNEMLQNWAMVKFDIVKEDPLEVHQRKILNAGHTVGHGIESYFLNHHIPTFHGHCVAYGLWIESWINKTYFGNSYAFNLLNDCVLKKFLKPKTLDAHEIVSWINNDKKNQNGQIVCSFVNNPFQLNLKEISTAQLIAGINAYSKA